MLGSMWSWSPAPEWGVLRCWHFEQGGTTSSSMCHRYRHGMGTKGPLIPTPGTWMSWEHTTWQHLLMLGGSILESEVPWSLSHARAVGCSSVISLRMSSRPLAMEEIFSFWAAARFSKKRALQDGVDVGWEQSREGTTGTNHTMPHCTDRPIAQKPPALATPHRGRQGFNLL